MNIRKREQYNRLFEIYRSLLNQKQNDYLEAYLLEDLSLSEIAENHGISKQAISEQINKSLTQLDVFEEKLKLIAKSNERDILYNQLRRENNRDQIIEIINHLSDLEN